MTLGKAGMKIESFEFWTSPDYECRFSSLCGTWRTVTASRRSLFLTAG
ncbi:MAG: hypothetical protein IAC23_07500 [Bacteroidetes bacterium]|uniref:Uncharacterized protein n=1 Tax=Candidatus Cryptobacteroides merdavium TaxID=2840769 RepID=A0A9D9ECM7_9BACT|nr:hypothetical protein [Candidatus Cryptobacteroides merdavium]